MCSVHEPFVGVPQDLQTTVGRSSVRTVICYLFILLVVCLQSITLDTLPHVLDQLVEASLDADAWADHYPYGIVDNHLLV